MADNRVEIWTRDGAEIDVTITNEDVVSQLEELPFTTPHVTVVRVTPNQ